MDIMGAGADLASIATAGIAVWAWASYSCQRYKRRKRLEAYLQKVREEALQNPNLNGEGMRSLIHLMSHLYMTESQVYEAAFSSRKVNSRPRNGEGGVADLVMFQFNPAARSRRKDL